MAEQKKRVPIEISPEGVLAYAWIYKKDTKFAKTEDDGRYKGSLIVDKDGPHVAWAMELHAIHVDKMEGSKKNSPVKDGDKMKDKDGKAKEDFANAWLVNFKSQYKPNVVDAKKRPLTGDVKVSSGDLVKIAFQRNEYDTGATQGLSLRMAAIQVIDKRAGEGLGAAAAAAFGEEDGFETPEDAGGSSGDDEAPPAGNGDF